MADKILGSDKPVSPNNPGKIPGSQTQPAPGSPGYIPGTQKDPETSTSDTAGETAGSGETDITLATIGGGLLSVPVDFESKNGSWKTIHAENPFEILYIDYKLYELVTPEMVKKNFDILSAFWSDKYLIMSTGAREKIKSRYGEETVTQASRLLEAAYNKIKSREGIQLYYNEINRVRYNNGIRSIEELIDAVLAGGELRKEQAIRIIANGARSGLSEKEVRDHLHERLIKNSFKQWSDKKVADIFDGQWMTEEKKESLKSIAVDWLGTSVSTLEEAGEVTYNNREKACQRIANANYLPVLVTQLTNAEKGFEFEEIITGEHDIERRYLKVLYHLNPYLPFRLGSHAFTNIRQVFDMTMNDYALYTKVVSSYQSGHIHVWLKEADGIHALLLTPGLDYNSFLTFLYIINSKHPFYLDAEKFDTPQQMMQNAGTNVSLWPMIAEATANQQLPIWFAGIGRKDWQKMSMEQQEKNNSATYYSTEEKKLALVQYLIKLIDSNATDPRIVTDQENIKLLSIGGNKVVSHTLYLELKNSGFAKAIIYFKKPVNGITLSHNTFNFWSQNNATVVALTLKINAQQLISNQYYLLDLSIDTEFQKLLVPVEVKVVFPKNAYLLQVLKYSVFGALFFSLVRYATGTLVLNDSWFEPELYNALPPSYFTYFITLAVFLSGLIGSIFLIKRIEKI